MSIFISRDQAAVILELIKTNQGPQYYELCEHNHTDPHELTSKLMDLVEEGKHDHVVEIIFHDNNKAILANPDDVVYDDGWVVARNADGAFISSPKENVKYVSKSST